MRPQISIGQRPLSGVDNSGKTGGVIPGPTQLSSVLWTLQIKVDRTHGFGHDFEIDQKPIMAICHGKLRKNL